MNNIRKIRKNRGLTLQQVAMLIGTTLSSVARYEKEDNRLTLPLMKKIAKALGCRVQDLYEEKLEIAKPYMAQVVPILEYKDALAKYPEKEPEEWVQITDRSIPRDAYILVVRGDAMSPIFPEGSKIIITPIKEMKRKVKNKDFVIATIENSKDILFRQFIEEGGYKHLRAANDLYPTISQVKIKLQGVVIRSVIDYRDDTFF